MKYSVEFSGKIELDMLRTLSAEELETLEGMIKAGHTILNGPGVHVKVTPVAKTFTITYRDDVLLHTVVEADNIQAAADKFREQYLNCRIERIVLNE